MPQLVGARDLKVARPASALLRTDGLQEPVLAHQALHHARHCRCRAPGSDQLAGPGDAHAHLHPARVPPRSPTPSSSCPASAPAARSRAAARPARCVRSCRPASPPRRRGTAHASAAAASRRCRARARPRRSCGCPSAQQDQLGLLLRGELAVLPDVAQESSSRLERPMLRGTPDAIAATARPTGSPPRRPRPAAESSQRECQHPDGVQASPPKACATASGVDNGAGLDGAPISREIVTRPRIRCARHRGGRRRSPVCGNVALLVAGFEIRLKPRLRRPAWVATVGREDVPRARSQR